MSVGAVIRNPRNDRTRSPFAALPSSKPVRAINPGRTGRRYRGPQDQPPCQFEYRECSRRKPAKIAAIKKLSAGFVFQVLRKPRMARDTAGEYQMSPRPGLKSSPATPSGSAEREKIQGWPN